MAPILFLYAIVIFWTAGFPDWIVAYATGVAQLGIWVTLLSLIPFCAVWVSLKTGFFAEISEKATSFSGNSVLKSSLDSANLCMFYRLGIV